MKVIRSEPYEAGGPSGLYVAVGLSWHIEQLKAFEGHMLSNGITAFGEGSGASGYEISVLQADEGRFQKVAKEYLADSSTDIILYSHPALLTASPQDRYDRILRLFGKKLHPSQP